MLPAADARHFADTLQHASQSPVVHAELPRAQHNVDLFRSPRAHAVINGIDASAARTLPRSASATRDQRGN